MRGRILSAEPASFTIRPGSQARVSGWILEPDGSPGECEEGFTFKSEDNDVLRLKRRDGLFEGRGEGSTLVTVWCGALQDTVWVRVTNAAVAGVRVRPAGAVVATGQSVSFVAEARDADGGALSDRGIRWVSLDTTVAVVDEHGNVETRAPGRVRVVAMSDDQDPDVVLARHRRAPRSAGRAGALASAADEEPPPTAPDTAMDNEALIDIVPFPLPGGGGGGGTLTTLTERPFSGFGEGWDRAVEERYPGLVFQADSLSAFSSPGFLNVRYPVGYEAGNSPGIAQFPFSASSSYGTLHTTFWIRLSPNWLGHRSKTNKIFFWWIAGGAKVFMSAEGLGDGPLSVTMRLQGVPDARPDLRPNLVPSAQFVRGQWHKVEVYLQANTAGRSNGVVEWWLDGVKVGSVRDANLVTIADSDRFWHQLQLNPIWGGGAQTITSEQQMHIDHVVLRAGR